MNPTREAAIWLHSYVSTGPEWLQGSAIMLGILIPFFAACVLAIAGEWAYRKWFRLWS